MSAHGHAAELTHEHSVGTTKLFATVWVWLLLLTAVEVFLAYERLEVHLMITILVGLSLIKAALIMSYFMHLRFKRLGLFLLLVPAMVFCICMMLFDVFSGQHTIDEFAAALGGWGWRFCARDELKREMAIRFGLLASGLAGLIALPMPRVVAQGCAMCFQSAAASGPQGAAALRHGILILLFPTMSIFVGILGLMYRRRNVAR